MAIALVAGGLSAAQAFNNGFNSLTMSDNVSVAGPLTCSSSMPSVPTSHMSMTVPPGSGDWSMLVSNTYPKTWKGTASTQSWTISGAEMSTHAEATANDGGLVWISRSAFDKSKYLSAVGMVSLDACRCPGAAGCMADVALINTESDYYE